jgi:putative intracellular protease/amidase
VAKRYDEPIDVTSDRSAGAPVSFSWRGRRYFVDQHLADWRDAGEYWDGPAHRDRRYHRVLAHPAGAAATGEVDADGFLRTSGAVYDIYCDRAGGAWRLERIWD